MKSAVHIEFTQGPIRLGRKLATGATAEVYQGFTSQEEPVAIKRVQQSNELLQESYRRELKSMALVCPHANVVALLDAATINDSGCLMLELCAQGSLKTIMQNQELTEAQVARAILDVSCALSHIHRKSVVHRDLRPDNVLLGNDFRMKLADFGSSAFIDELQTMTKGKLTTDTYRYSFPHYQAPEQINSEFQTTKIDIWGLGCLVYALLLQENAFSANDQASQLRGAYRKPRKRLNPKWKQVFDACFQIDPSRRASAEDILHLISLDKLPQTVPVAESDRSSKFSVLLDLFKSSTNSWVKAATASRDGAPEAHYVHKLLMKVWRMPVKAQKLYQSISKRPLHKAVVAIKCLMLIHRYLYSGPSSVFADDPGPTATLNLIGQAWTAENATSRRKDLASADYFGALIRKFADVLKVKVGIHILLNCRGNWTLERVSSVEQLDELFSYWSMLIALCNGLYHSVNDLPGTRSGLAQQLLIEMMNLFQLLSRSVGPNQAEDFKQRYSSTTALITKVRKFIPNLPIPELNPDMPNELFQSQLRHEQPSAPLPTEPEELKSSSSGSLDASSASENFKSSTSSSLSVPSQPNARFNSVGSSQQAPLYPLLDFSMQSSVPPSTDQPSYSQMPSVSQSSQLQSQSDFQPISASQMSSQSSQMPVSSHLPSQSGYPSIPRFPQVPIVSSAQSKLPPLMPSPVIQGLEPEKPKEPSGPKVDMRVIVSMDDITFGERLGIGSSCTVFKGTYKKTVVAIKMIKASQSSAFTLEFEREIAAMSGLRHPNLVLFMGAVIKPSMAIVTEFCGGDTLFKLLHQSRDVMLSWPQRLQMAKDIAQGMCYLHGLRPPVLHRDLKSLNLLLRDPVTTALDPVHLKITDFGVARLLDAEDIHLTGQTGTAHWMAPEVIANQPYSLAADVYSFGIVLWEICARDTPYRNIMPALIPAKVLQARERPGLSTIPSSCPEKLKQLIPMCWHHDPGRRPTFEQICDMLDTIAA
mmetsp:Transcript_18144/g.32490  ORF Transcript_18144/g.32490 Transcript_18144/m.32490 type:complete len:986 (-) Transcript_18144:41-2998(-)|eukprot:CAMPEP_0204901876 /NCGR_PEP_ID=MMETSP1397-20131031/3339_1 /ASSEMBLY_ACC=CAM_ASM_000891 /TAXON_ID=49980 /ORGANISM="Climacostomum Climacostomum virens, Strain Stock W-24" /LENGTH=985 /DNA_ID=CAMNT_0052070299 /DNA_START=6 /DNA_END=2966 /DNA_ORIENTATION=-